MADTVARYSSYDLTFILVGRQKINKHMITYSGKCYEGNKWVLREKKIRGGDLNGVVKEGSSEEVTFKLKSAG